MKSLRNVPDVARQSTKTHLWLVHLSSRETIHDSPVTCLTSLDNISLIPQILNVTNNLRVEQRNQGCLLRVGRVGDTMVAQNAEKLTVGQSVGVESVFEIFALTNYFAGGERGRHGAQQSR